MPYRPVFSLRNLRAALRLSASMSLTGRRIVWPSFILMDISLILGDLCDLVNGEMFFKDFCVPSYCEYAVVSREAVDQGAEVQGKEEYCSQDKEHHHYPEDGSFGAVQGTVAGPRRRAAVLRGSGKRISVPCLESQVDSSGDWFVAMLSYKNPGRMARMQVCLSKWSSQLFESGKNFVKKTITAAVITPMITEPGIFSRRFPWRTVPLNRSKKGKNQDTHYNHDH